MKFWIGLYRDSETGRARWAAFDYAARVWYFPSRYGKRAAESLVNRLNHT